MVTIRELVHLGRFVEGLDHLMETTTIQDDWKKLYRARILRLIGKGVEATKTLEIISLNDPVEYQILSLAILIENESLKENNVENSVTLLENKIAELKSINRKNKSTISELGVGGAYYSIGFKHVKS